MRSLTTPNENLGVIQGLIERVLLAKYRLPPYFWSKKKCEPAKFNQQAYSLNQRLYGCFTNISKKFGEDILSRVVLNTQKNGRLKMIEAAQYNQVGKIISTLAFYCGKEKEMEEAAAAPKDEGEAQPILYESVPDMRPTIVPKKVSPWRFLIGKEEG